MIDFILGISLIVVGLLWIGLMYLVTEMADVAGQAKKFPWQMWLGVPLVLVGIALIMWR